MKTDKKLVLDKETLKALEAEDSREVLGGRISTILWHRCGGSGNPCYRP